MIDYFDLGQRIRKYRLASKLTQAQLADKVDISDTHMSHIETANTKLSLQTFYAIAEALEVSTDALLHDTPVVSKNALTAQILELLESCTVNDLYILYDVLKATKISLDKYNK
ncbi:MAG: helix-turn-helix domain-containing protein [Erysipelotrichaceae bacterium]|nr:helix-turn-helix domain-containing protein [Erysipelotrichaceae bacterium]